MRLIPWLDRLSSRPRSLRGELRHTRGRARLRWRVAEVESLEDRTQLTALTYSATDLPLQIPPGDPKGTGTTVSTIHVPDDFIVQDVNVQLNIEHTYDSDLAAVLISPGTRRRLFGGVGGDGDNFIETVLDREADTPIGSALAPFTGTFRPVQPFVNFFYGYSGQGDWKLEITDVEPADSGTLVSWSLILGYSENTIADTVGNTLTTAEFVDMPLRSEVSIDDFLNGSKDVDLFAVELLSGDLLTATTDSDEFVDTVLRVFDGTGKELKYSDDYSKTTKFSQLSFSAITDGVYYVGISNSPNDKYGPLSSTSVESPFATGYTLLLSRLDPIPEFVSQANDSIITPKDTPATNSGEFAISRGTLTISASQGTLTDYGNGTWSWSQLGDPDADSSIVAITATNEHGESAITTFDVTFTNIAPTFVSQTKSSIETPEDIPATNSGVFTDYNDALAIYASQGELIDNSDGSWNWSQSGDAGTDSGIVTVTAINDHGQSVSTTFDVTFTNVAPTFVSQSKTFVSNLENTLVTNSGGVEVTNCGVFADYNDRLTIFASEGELTDFGDGSWSWFQWVEAGTDPRIVTVTATNEHGQSVSTTFEVAFLYVDLQPTANDGDYSLTITRRGKLTISLAVTDGSPFAGTLTLLTPDLRLVIEHNFRHDAGTEPVKFTEFIGPGNYLVRIRRQSLADGLMHITTAFDARLPPGFPMPVGDFPNTVLTEDVNRDGNIDLITLNANSTVSVLLGHPDGTFEDQQPSGPFDVGSSSEVGSGVLELQAAYLNNDNKIYILVTNPGSGYVSVLLGNGNGTFEIQPRLLIAYHPSRLHVVDINDDGDLDLIAQDLGQYDSDRFGFFDRFIAIRYGREGGGFEDEEQRFTIGDGNFDVDVVDVNRDQYLDFVATNPDHNDVSVRVARHDRTFKEERRYQVGDGEFGVLVTDINDDKQVDLIRPNSRSGDVSVLLGNRDGSFKPQKRFLAGDFPKDVHALYLDGDHQIDLVVVGDEFISVLLGDSDRTFADERRFPLSAFVGALGAFVSKSQLVDVDGDEKLDVVASTLYEALVFLNRGDGTFAIQQRTPLDNGTLIRFADVNRDGRPDLIRPNQSADVVSVLLGRGDGTFQARRRFATGEFPQTLQVVDFNEDGRVDLLTANRVSNDLSVLLGKGDGSFENQRRFAAYQASGAKATDVNHDGRQDIVAVIDDDVVVAIGHVAVFLGRGDGAFNEPQLFDLPRFSKLRALVDLNGDGWIDVVTSNEGEHDEEVGFFNGSVSVLLGTPGGGFINQPPLPGGDGLLEVLVADFNKDKLVDILTLNRGKRHREGAYHHENVSVFAYHGGSVSVIFGQRDGKFAEPRTIAIGDDPQDVVVKDVDHDSVMDIVVVNRGRQDLNFTDGNVAVLLGRGHGNFQEARHFRVGNNSESTLAREPNIHVRAVDIDGDTDVDLMTLNGDTNDVSVLLGNGDGTFKTQSFYSVGDNPTEIDVADVNDDQSVDLVVLNERSEPGDNSADDVSVLLGRGDGTFEDQRLFAAGDFPTAQQIADVNGDGFRDIVVLTDNSFPEASILLGDGRGEFFNSLSLGPVAVGTRPVIADINRDGVDDILVLRQDGAVLYRQGKRVSTKNTPTSQVAQVEFGAAIVVNLVVKKVGKQSVTELIPARDFTLLRSPDKGLRIATVDQTGRTVSFYRFNGAGSHASFVLQPVESVRIRGSLAALIVSGNFDGDPAGRDDFALLNQGTQSVTLYLATATGFREGQTFDTGAGPVSFTKADLNHDLVTDLLVPNFNSGDVSVFQNAGAGDFTTSVRRTGPGPYFIGPTTYDSSRIESQSFEQTSSAEVGDFDNDGWPDVIATNPGSNSFSILYGGPRGLGSDPQITLLRSSPSRFAAVRVADVDLDGDDDAVFLNESGTQLSVYLNETGSRTRESSERSLTTSATTVLTLVATIDLPTPLTGFSLHDANEDGLPDVFATNEFGDLLLLLNQGAGEDSNRNGVLDTGEDTNRNGVLDAYRFAEDRHADRKIPLAVQDLNGDGKLDVVLANQGMDVVSIDYGGQKSPTKLKELAAGKSDGLAAPGAVKLADLDRDGVADLIVPNTGGNSVLIYKGHGDGTFATGESIFTGSNPASVTVSDLDHDGRQDLVVTNRGSNTVAVFYGQAGADSQTVAGATSIPFRAGALSKLPSGSGPVDAQVVSLKNADGSMQDGLVVTNSTGNSVSFIPSAGNGIFNQNPSNTVPLGFSPLPGAIVNGNLVLPNPGGNSLGFFPLSADLFSRSTSAVAFSLPVFDHPVGIDASADLNHDGLFDLLVANNGNGSVSLLLGDGNGFDFSGSFFLDGITHASALQVAGTELYVTEEGKEFFTVFDLEQLKFDNGDQIVDFEEVSGTVANTNRPIYGVGLLSPLLLAVFGQSPLEEGEAREDGSLGIESDGWETLARIVTHVTEQFEHISDLFRNSELLTMLESLSSDLGLHAPKLPQSSDVPFETLLTPLSLLSGTQPLTQLVRGLQRFWPSRPNAPANRATDSSTPPSSKTPTRIPTQTAPVESSAIPNDTNATEEAAPATDSAEESGESAAEASNVTRPPGLTNYMSQLATSSVAASELFDGPPKSPRSDLQEGVNDNSKTEVVTGWGAIVASSLVSPALTEFWPSRLRNRHSRRKIVRRTEQVVI